jgi:hypothetical protein
MQSPSHVSDALGALGSPGEPVGSADSSVPNSPGLYALHGDAEAWTSLGLRAPSGPVPLYVGKAEDSLLGRDMKTHFRSGKTGWSSVRRSFAALLRRPLDLHAVPRNVNRPEKFTNFGLDEAGDDRLTAWMLEHLTLAVWPKPDETVSLADLERTVLEHWQPPVNLELNRAASPALRAARSAMADEAREWATAHRRR